MDLSKDIMMDLGITVIGDIIAILRHAKQVYRQVGSVILISLYVHKNISNSEWLILIGHVLCFCRTCAKWQRKPFPQDRPALKLSLEELPKLVSVYASVFWLSVKAIGLFMLKSTKAENNLFERLYLKT